MLSQRTVARQGSLASMLEKEQASYRENVVERYWARTECAVSQTSAIIHQLPGVLSISEKVITPIVYQTLCEVLVG